MKIVSNQILEGFKHEIAFQKERVDYFKTVVTNCRNELRKQKNKLEGVTGERDRLKRELEELKTIKFSEKYEKRLEELKKSFNLQPSLHYLEIQFDNGKSKKVEGSMNILEELTQTIDEAIDEDFIFIRERYFRRGNIVSFEFYEGHPAKYTEEEIEDWAREKLDDEMDSWEVVDKKKGGLVKWLHTH
jgi:hypothetical protein